MTERVLSLKKKIRNEQNLKTIAKTLKVLAAINRVAYQKIVNSLEEYNKSIELGLIASLIHSPKYVETFELKKTQIKKVGAVIFGSDLGLVGQFNEALEQYAVKELNRFQVKKRFGS